MKKLYLGLIGFLIIVMGIGAYLWTPLRPFDSAAAIEASSAYDARVIRDAFGVPHIYGARDADVAFGLAYAHAEDDWKTIEDVIVFSRGELARRTGKDGAITDYLISALGIWRDLNAKYETDLTPQLRAVVEAYAAGINLWCAEARGRCARGVAPVSGRDVIAGFTARTPFFYGLDDSLKALFETKPETQAALDRVREAFLRVAPGAELGSNAMAVAPSRSADGHTRLMVNSHQPYTGPVAWYEARLKSEEGWDMIGGIFPGSPVILHGAGPDLGWAHTVNLPDLVDAYALDVDDPATPTKYRLDGEWRPLEISSVTLRVKLFGPFSLPVSRKIYRSVHGPVFVTPGGVFAVAYGGEGDIRSAEQWYRMNKARDFEEWRSAMAMQAIPSFNSVYADRGGKIAYYYNAAIPVRSSDQDWSRIADGARSDLVWKGVEPFGTAPFVIDPASGYVVNSNHSPFEASGPGDNPDPADFRPSLGIDERVTNRGLRTQALYGGDASITAEEFVAYKMDDAYAEDSLLRRTIMALLDDGDAADDPQLTDALAVLAAWNGSAAHDNRQAALAIRAGHLALGYQLHGDGGEIGGFAAAVKQAATELREGFGRLDPEWGEVVRLKRGDLDLPLDGGPDTLRAVYPAGSPAEGEQIASGGDTYILYADWPAVGGAPTIRTIHQFGSATLDVSSPHYGDQAPLFAQEEWKTPPMTLDALLAEATDDYRPGRRGESAYSQKPAELQIVQTGGE
jgi:penicillin amidase/acyl-homoserine-lactone acylase